MIKLSMLWIIFGIFFGTAVASTGVKGLHFYLVYFAGIAFGIVSHILIKKLAEKDKQDGTI